MLSLTRTALEEFDNSHDFERMAADILNALGYEDVEPMAPTGGADVGTDIKYSDAGARGIAFVTLNKNIKVKFTSDLAKVGQDQVEAFSLFCTVNVTPRQKVELAQMVAKLGATLTVYDLERLRSLLDTSLKEIRRRYLRLDDEVSAQIRSKVAAVLRFPEKHPLDTATMSIVERMYLDQRPAKVFAVLRDANADVVRTVPEVGTTLEAVQRDYYDFNRAATNLFQTMLDFIGRNVAVRFPAGWRIYVRYAFPRLIGHTRAEIEAEGDFLNYGITWEDAERVALLLQSDTNVMGQLHDLSRLHVALCAKVDELSTSLAR